MSTFFPLFFLLHHNVRHIKDSRISKQPLQFHSGPSRADHSTSGHKLNGRPQPHLPSISPNSFDMSTRPRRKNVARLIANTRHAYPHPIHAEDNTSPIHLRDYRRNPVDDQTSEMTPISEIRHQRETRAIVTQSYSRSYLSHIIPAVRISSTNSRLRFTTTTLIPRRNCSAFSDSLSNHNEMALGSLHFLELSPVGSTHIQSSFPFIVCYDLNMLSFRGRNQSPPVSKSSCSTLLQHRSPNSHLSTMEEKLVTTPRIPFYWSTSPSSIQSCAHMELSTPPAPSTYS